MFWRDQPEIAAYAHTGPDQMARVLTFVYLTVQQSIFVMPDAVKDVLRNGVEARSLWGFKIGAYEWLEENKESVYTGAMDLWRAHPNPRHAADELLHYYASMPGLGLIKAGFSIQLMFGLSGCFDTHNLEMYGVSPSRFKASRFKEGSPRVKSRMVGDYNDLCEDLGTDYLWDNWCQYVAKRNNTSADAVSRIHVDAILQEGPK